MNIHIETFDQYDMQHRLSAYAAGHWAAASGVMRELNHRTMAESAVSYHAFSEAGEPLGHIALQNPGEIGGLVVNPDWRGRRIGQALVRHLIRNAAEASLQAESYFAYANEQSAPVFAAVGGHFAGHRPVPPGGHSDMIYDMSEAVHGSLMVY